MVNKQNIRCPKCGSHSLKEEDHEIEHKETFSEILQEGCYHDGLKCKKCGCHFTIWAK